MPAPIISLTTDFGSVSGYAGTVKGVLLGINPASTIVDISHDVPAQDISHGAFVLGSAYRYFDNSTIHLAVVDSGVGSSRRAILLVTPEGRFLAPDNGLLTYVVMGHASEPFAVSCVGFMEPVLVAVPEGCAAYATTRPEYWRHPVRRTFQARDIFAPVAAHLSLGVAPNTVGEQVDIITALNAWSEPDDDAVLHGRVIFVDGFGNLVTNLRSDCVQIGFRAVQCLWKFAGSRCLGLLEPLPRQTGSWHCTAATAILRWQSGTEALPGDSRRTCRSLGERATGEPTGKFCLPDVTPAFDPSGATTTRRMSSRNPHAWPLRNHDETTMAQ